MRILNIAMFLLLGACSVAANKAPETGKGPETGKDPVVENFGGDINSPNGQRWLTNTFLKGRPWSVTEANGSWVPSTESNAEMHPILGTGDIDGLSPKKNGVYTFVGAPSPTTAFYRSPQFRDTSLVESRLEGFFVTNFTDRDGIDKTLIYPAALRLTKAETDAIEAQVGIPADLSVAEATAEQQKRYNDIVHVPSNYDLTKPAQDAPWVLIEVIQP